jgi:serine/threonine-protein kinase
LLSSSLVGSDGQRQAEERVFGPWVLESFVGRGGGGEVYRARHRDTGVSAAVKLAHAELMLAPEARERFRREAAALARLDDPHVVRVLASGEEGGRLYLAMEWLDGETLATRVSRGALPLAEVLGIVKGIASGLEALHAEGVIHRDLKAANVMIGPAGVKLLDLGIAYLLDEGLARITASGLVPGSLAAMSPEQLAGAPVTQAADIWALGVLVYQMLTGKLPFDAANTTDLARLVAQGATPSVRGAGGAPLAVDAVLARCFAHDPAQRFASAGRVAVALAAAATSTSTSSVRRLEPGQAAALALHLGGEPSPTLCREATARCEAFGFTVVSAAPESFLAVKLLAAAAADREAARALTAELAGLGATVTQQEGQVTTLTVDGRRQIVGGDLLAFSRWAVSG